MRLEKIGTDRLKEAERISSIAFTYPYNEPAPSEENRSVEDTMLNSERWGMIDEKTDRLMGGMILLDYRTRVGEKWLPLTGIGGVATLPEYRREGVIRQIFTALLPRMYERGAALSGLYPFSHAFYRKFGYETFGGQNTATVGLEQLRRFAAPDEVRMIADPRDDLAARGIYERFASRYDLAMRRDLDYQWKRTMGGDPYKERVYKYLLLRRAGEELEPCAYIVFTPDESDSAGRVANAREAAYLDGDALRRLLGFMSTFFPHYRKLRIPLPGDVNLAALCPDAYDVHSGIAEGYMLRAVNVRLLLESQPLSPALKLAAQAAPLSFSLALSDELIPMNTGRYEVTITPEGVRCEQGPLAPADIEVSITAFAQLATGALSLRQAAYRDDVQINAPCPAAEALFTGRPQYIGDHY